MQISKKIMAGIALIAASIGTVTVIGSLGKGTLLALGIEETVNESLTFTFDDLVASSGNNLETTFKKTSSRGTDIYMYSTNKWAPKDRKLVGSFGNTDNYLAFYLDSTHETAMPFQNVTSLVVETNSTSASSASFSLSVESGGSLSILIR